MDIGIFLAVEPFRRTAAEEYASIVELAQAAEELGYHSLWLASRHFSPEYAAAPAPLMVLAAAASRTESILLGTSIVTLPLENPIRIAEHFATLDALSDGRGRLGVGSGDDQRGFAAFGIDFEERQGMLTEMLPALIDILEGKGPGSETLFPPIAAGRSKLALGAQSARGATWAASLGVDLLQGRSEPNSADPTASQVRAAEAYRQIHPGKVVTARNVWVGTDKDQSLLDALGRHDAYLQSRGRPGLPQDPMEAIRKMNILSGTPEQLAAELKARVSPIVPDELLLTVDPGGLDAGERIRRFEQMASALGLTAGPKSQN